MQDNMTIAAIATPIGRGGVGIIRISGPEAENCAKAILGHIPKNRYAEYLPFKDTDHSIIDRGIALFFKGPESFTGEDVLELQAHGGSVVLDMLLKTVLKNNNVRIAQPGEFSERAFLNDKIDLTQAEAIADLIDASSEQACKSALNSLEGEFSRKINSLVEELINLRIFVEASIDFPDGEDIDFIDEGRISDKSCSILEKIDSITRQAQNGAILREGIKIVIAGRPNVGKSSILNRLSGKEAAIVTDVEGTTRDILKESITIDGLPLHIIDTAGLRETSDLVEKIGVSRAWHEINEADLVLLVLDATKHISENLEIYRDITSKMPSELPLLTVFNKTDIGNNSTVKEIDSPIICISAKTGKGLDELREYLKKTVGYSSTVEGTFIARRRHLDSLERARSHIKEAIRQIQEFQSGELAAEEFRMAQENLNEITGKFTSDDLLGRIFSSFCIGK